MIVSIINFGWPINSLQNYQIIDIVIGVSLSDTWFSFGIVWLRGLKCKKIKHNSIFLNRFLSNTADPNIVIQWIFTFSLFINICLSTSNAHTSLLAFLGTERQMPPHSMNRQLMRETERLMFQNIIYVSVGAQIYLIWIFLKWPNILTNLSDGLSQACGLWNHFVKYWGNINCFTQKFFRTSSA